MGHVFNPDPPDSADREFWITIRQALIIILGAVEDRLKIPRTYKPKRKSD